MLKRLWLLIKDYIQQLSGNEQSIYNYLTEEKLAEIRRELEDTEYESLFIQLLVRVNDEGWNRGQVTDFLDANRINQRNLAKWLRGYGETLLASPRENDALASRIVRLGELGAGEVSDVAYDIGVRLLGRGKATNQVFGESRPANAEEAKEQGDAAAWFNQGNQQLMHGDFAGAIASLKKATKINHNLHIAWFNQGAAFYQLQQFEQVISACDKAIDIKPDFYQAWFNQATALEQLGRFDEAISSLETAIKVKPDFYQAWYKQAEILSQLKRFPEAIACCDQAVKIKPDYYQAWFHWGYMLAQQRQFEQAIIYYDTAIAIKPDYYQAWVNRGAAMHALKKLSAALSSYDRAIEIQPQAYLAWHNQGNILTELEQFAAALNAYNQALKIEPNYYQAWNNKGLVLRKLRLFQGSIAAYDRAIAINPQNCLVWNNRGLTLSEMGEYQAAIASYDKAIKINPNNKFAWNNRGTALSDLKLLEEAIASFDKAIEISFDFYEAWLNRGMTAGNSVNCDRLLALLSTVAIQNPQLNQRGYEGELASYEEGLKYCDQDTHPKGWGKLYQAMGNALYFRGRADSRPHSYWYKAVTNYNEALKTLTAADFPHLHLEVLQNLIRVQLNLGEKAKAEELKRRGTDILRRLLDECKSPEKKKQLALKFAGFQQLTVDLAVQSRNLSTALELAEQGKNACMSWLLDGWSDDSPKWVEMKKLLNPHTAIVYWHLSPAALHTFIFQHNTPSLIVLGAKSLTPVQRLRDFESWLKTWNEQYANYRQGKDKHSQDAKTWRDNLPAMLNKLSEILDINTIVSQIPDITQLILIPHRDLHRFPLHTLFPREFTISYLPSIQLGLISQSNENQLSNQLLSIEHPNSAGYPELEFAQVESQAICRLFPHNTRKRSEEATKDAVINALPQGYGILHFSGHGEYNFHNPALSHLALADKDKLTLTDIRDFDLRSYQLVSLAACETAITGNHTITTEYVGLVSGFMSCGVASVVSTLWTVESAASALVMIQFYQRLQQGKSKVVALAEATQWLRNVTHDELAAWYAEEIAKLPEEEGILRRFLLRHLNNLQNQLEPSNQPYNHPYFWAAFTITGIFPILLS
ncbi:MULTISPECIES: CHAT domain-containing protein [unclassified Tolypothrix]|uniref:CHAT domain-containing protein n=1 Tax=unclassified Tolypothrix TaxID=2649714 RepID=UPI0005EAB434|nr:MULTISPECIES: CHAT domain-containing protein [unclassified Tolypothrix]BAY94574.1 protein prenyltransferase, alpha subunit [Microchaete diplosiphon NIES-3275]EKE99220.1 tetratricopeptide repeat protein [Tolypothrix sp. PCC 7601]MBE9082014.1 tetratricopeptide repeat protein [Tolypothrix sp. LEGE 11397]UYD28276.1 tetratricopeptide repeat protein [Tolypothrix sp. PCC 7712]UYD35849.1 tetratricopeptide repeat protein [Tolypothrix sp. PCC 7601]